MKKLIAMLLCVSLCMSGSLTAFADNENGLDNADMDLNETIETSDEEQSANIETDEEIVTTEYENFAGTAGKVEVSVQAPVGAFPEGTVVDINKTNVSEKEMSSVIKDESIDFEILKTYAADITFTHEGIEQQPQEAVSLTMSLPAGTAPEDANMIAIVHMGENGPELVATKYLDKEATTHSVVVDAEGFSSYAAVYVNGKYNAKLMRDVLKDNPTYSISTFKVDLFDYDAKVFNDAHAGQNSFTFRGANTGDNADKGTLGINDSDQYASQGILQNELDANGMPIIKYSSDGAVTGYDLFSDTIAHAGKTIYKDIDFEVIYNKNTGYYEYKSSANHAQFNKETNTVELYADTLSPANNNTRTLTLNKNVTASSQVTISKSSATSIKGTTASLAEGTRLDASLTYSELSIPKADVNQIYIRVKIPATVKKNQFEVFYGMGKKNAEGKYIEHASFAANQSFTTEYTPNGEWMEIVLDTATTNKAWKENDYITSLRIDFIDSKPDSGVVYEVDETQSYTFEIEEISFLTDKDDHYTRGGFYPFSKIENSVPGNGDCFNYDTWASVQENSKLTTQIASRSVKNTINSNVLPYDELYFSTVMEFPFYIPVNKTASGEADNTSTETDNLRFEFTGDDDLWVFVDGKLVLDIGGGHGAVYGYVDFTTGQSFVEKTAQVTGFDSHDPKDEDGTTVTLADALSSPGKHTMKIFYMERCGTVSNCFLKYNLPQTPEAAVTVEKEIAEINDLKEADLTELYNKEYTFEMSVTDKGANPVKVEKLDYILYKRDESTGIESSLTPNTDGKFIFTLRAKDIAAFDISENFEVTVNEIVAGLENDDSLPSYVYQGTQGLVTVNKADTPVSNLTHQTVNGGSLKYVFTNSYLKLADLVISKAGIEDVDNHAENGKNKTEKQSTIFTVTGPQGYLMDVVIHGNDHVTIEHLVPGEYTVTEKTDWSWRYTPVDEQDSQTIELDAAEANRLDFENNREQIYWLSGDNFKANVFSALTSN